jgi:hypothetical protein
MQPTRPRAPAGTPKAKVRKKRPSPADPNERLKPVSLHGMELDDVLRKLVKRREPVTSAAPPKARRP